MNVLIVGAGGFIGAVLRYLIGLIPLKQMTVFPVKTLCINIIGSFIIGLVTAYAVKHGEFRQSLQLFLKVGICGGFTTFSSFALETMNLLESGNSAYALLYPCLSIICGVAAVYAAGLLVR